MSLREALWKKRSDMTHEEHIEQVVRVNKDPRYTERVVEWILDEYTKQCEKCSQGGNKE
jgi:hypothetical protein